jgi:hypothetical protein
MSETAQLREQIQARKFRVMELEVKIGNIGDEIRFMIGTKLTKNTQIPFATIAHRAQKAAELSDLHSRLQTEIALAEKELEE